MSKIWLLEKRLIELFYLDAGCCIKPGPVILFSSDFEEVEIRGSRFSVLRNYINCLSSTIILKLLDAAGSCSALMMYMCFPPGISSSYSLTATTSPFCRNNTAVGTMYVFVRMPILANFIEVTYACNGGGEFK